VVLAGGAHCDLTDGHGSYKPGSKRLERRLFGKASPHSQGRKGQRAALLRMLTALSKMVNFAAGKEARCFGLNNLPVPESRKHLPTPRGSNTASNHEI